MRRSLVLLFGAFALLIVTVAGPASAAPATEPVGERVAVLGGGTVELEAGEAFHVQHGWGPLSPSEAGPIGHWGFWLEIDGVDQGRGQPVNFAFGPDGGVVRTVLYNYPEGLPAGEYVFTGHWFGPCHEVVEQLEAIGLPGFECEFKNEEVDFPIEDAFGIPAWLTVMVTG